MSNLEKKRFSITRLKQIDTHNEFSVGMRLKRKDSRLRDWNIGDRKREFDATAILEKKRFSITRLKLPVFSIKRWIASKLEKKRFSITRLKQGLSWRPGLGFYAWKEKILDYEIETWPSIAKLHTSR